MVKNLSFLVILVCTVVMHLLNNPVSKTKDTVQCPVRDSKQVQRGCWPVDVKVSARSHISLPDQCVKISRKGNGSILSIQTQVCSGIEIGSAYPRFSYNSAGVFRKVAFTDLDRPGEKCNLGSIFWKTMKPFSINVTTIHMNVLTCNINCYAFASKLGYN